MVYRNAEKYATKDAPFRIYIGYDSHEDIAWEVCRYSIMSRSSVPVDIIPLKRAEFQKRKVYYREHDPKQSTEFTYLRFLVPYLNNYKGWAMFVDDDFLFMRDIAELLDLIDDRYALMCVQHDYKPTVTKKLAGKEQEPYPRKNWSSLMLWNCGHPANQAVTLGLVNSETGRYLHRFSWIEDDSLIGSLPVYWNFLTPWYKKMEDSAHPGAVHYTEGGPWFPDYRQDAETDYKEEWFEELKKYEATLAQPRQLCPYELFSQNGVKPLSGYTNSACRWDWDAEKTVATA